MIVADTHTAIWLTKEQEELSASALAALRSGRLRGGIGISAVTLWEVAMLMTSGTIALDQPLPAYLEHLESVFVVLAIDARIAARSVSFSRRFPGDPADRLIAATALVPGSPLVTKDATIRKSGEVACIW